MKNFFIRLLIALAAMLGITILGVIIQSVFFPDHKEKLDGISGLAILISFLIIFGSYIKKFGSYISQPLFKLLPHDIVQRIIKAFLVFLVFLFVSVQLIAYSPFDKKINDLLSDLSEVLAVWLFFLIIFHEYKKQFLIGLGIIVVLILSDFGPDFLLYGLPILAFIGYMAYVLTIDLKKECKHCKGSKLSFQSGKETEFSWQYSNKDGSPDKRHKNNFQVASYISKWSCKDCNKYTEFKHSPSKKPSKKDKIELAL